MVPILKQVGTRKPANGTHSGEVRDATPPLEEQRLCRENRAPSLDKAHARSIAQTPGADRLSPVLEEEQPDVNRRTHQGNCVVKPRAQRHIDSTTPRNVSLASIPRDQHEAGLNVVHAEMSTGQALLNEFGPGLVDELVPPDYALFAANVYMHSGTRARCEFSCVALPDIGSPGSFIQVGPCEIMESIGASTAA